MLKILQNKWLVAILLILGIAAAGAFLLMSPPDSVERKGISLDRDKLPQRQKQDSTKESESAQTAPQREPVGSVTQLKGMAFADFEKEKRALEEGSPIFQGDRIVTGAKARVILKMKDDAVIALGEDSEFLVQEYTFKVKPDDTVSEDDGNKGEVKLTKGVAKFTSGRLGKLKSKPFHLVTPVATMGVRGTEGYIDLKGAGISQEINVISLKDEVLVWMEEASKDDLSSSSGEIQFLAALISEAVAADLGKEPATVKKNQMLSAAKGKPPVVAPAPPEKLKEANTSTVVRKLPAKSMQALSKKVAQSLVDSGAAANVEEAQKLLEKSPEVLDKMVEVAEDGLMKETEAKVEAALESEKQLGKVEEEIKAAQASGDTGKLAELNDKKAALESKAVDMVAATSSEVDESSSEKALEKTASKMEDFSKDVAKAVSEGKSLQEVIEDKAKVVKEEKKEKAKALGVDDYDQAKKVGETVKENAQKPKEEGDNKPPPPSPKDTGKPSPSDAGKPSGSADAAAKPEVKGETKGEDKPGLGGDKVEGESGKKDTGATGETKNDAGAVGKEGDKGAKTPPPVEGKPGGPVGGTDPAAIFNEAAKGASGGSAATPAAAAAAPAASNTASKSTSNPTPATFNKPPVMVAQTFSMDENKPAKTVVGTLAAKDPDKGNVLVYTLTPTDVFMVDAATGVITADATLDFEKVSSYLLTATVTDNVPDNTKDKKITTITAAITINVNNVNEAPTVVLSGPLSVDEDSPLPLAGIAIADPDFGVKGGDTVVVPGDISVKLEAIKGNLNLTDLSGTTISGGASGSKTLTLKGNLSALNTALGKVVYTPEKDFNGSDTVAVGVDDLGYLGSGGPLTATGTIAITVKPVNDPPVFTVVDYKFTVNENLIAGAVVGSVVATDIENETLTYDITKGNTGNVFAINPATGQITVNKEAKLDYEKDPIFNLEVGVKDSGSSAASAKVISAKVVVEVVNLNEPPILVLPAPVSVLEDSPLPLAGIAISDPDFGVKGGDTVVVSGEMSVKLEATKGNLNLTDLSGTTISGGASGSKSLTLKGNLAALNTALGKVVYTPEKDFNGSDAVAVGVDDLGYLGSGGPLTATGTIVITVKPVNDPPVFTAVDLKFTVNENLTAGAVVGSVVATDIENETLTYDITKGNTGNVFAINPATGQITVNKEAKLDYEKDPIFNLEVGVKDSGPPETLAKVIPAKVVVDVVNLNEPPILVLPASVSVLEDTIKVLSDIVVDDPDLTPTSTQTLKLTLSVVKGTLSVSPDHGNAVRSLAITDTLVNIRRELGKLNYQGDSNYFGADTLTVTLDDQGNIGAGASIPANGTVSIVVVPVNDDPAITPIANVIIDEDKATSSLTFQVGDGDNKPSELTVKAVSSNTDLVPAENMVLAGTDTDRTITLTPVADRFGESTITLTVLDIANPAATAKTTFKLTVRPVVDKPVITLATTTEDVQTAAGLVISRNSLDGDEVTYYRIANIVNGLVFKKDGSTAVNDGDFITVEEATAGLRFTPMTNLNSDGGASTFGFDVYGSTLASINGMGPQKVTAVITVKGVNDPPTITVPSTPIAKEDTNQTITGLSIADVDAGIGIEKVTLSAAKGTLTLSSIVDITIDSGANGSNTIVMKGQLPNINTALSGLIYKGDLNFYGNDTLTIKVDDQGNSGVNATALTAEKTVTINVAAVNDAPVITRGTTSRTYTEGDAVANNTPITVDTFFAVADVDDSTLTGATITISSGFDVGKDLLDFSNTISITKSWNAATGVLTLTGVAALSDYQAAMRGVSYTSTSDDPTAGNRTISITVTDGKNISDAVAYTITVVPVNDPPIVTAGGTLNYIENDVATPFDTTFTVIDLDNTVMAGATVTISSGYQNNSDGADILAFTNTSNITGTWNAKTGVMTLTGSATKAAYVTALKSITYYHNGDNPLTAARTLTTAVSDSTASNSAVTSTVNMTAVNDVPVVNVTATLTYLEGVDAVQNAAAVVDAGITITDAERDTITAATITVSTNYVNGEDKLIFPATLGAIRADTSNGTSGWNASAGTLKLTGSGTLAEYQDALKTVQYNNLNSDNPTDSTRTVSFYVTDTGQSLVAKAYVIVVPQNDSPTLTAGGTPLTLYTEDSPSAKHADFIDDGLVIADVDDTNIDGATVTITAGLDANKDVLSFSGSNTYNTNITGSYSTTTGVYTLSGSDTKANYQAALRAVTYSNNSDSPSIVSRVILFKIYDGALYSGVVSRTVAVKEVNDAPAVVSGGTMTYTENAAATVVHSGITVTDYENSDIIGATVTITGYAEDRLSYTSGDGITGTWVASAGTPGTGTLTLIGTAKSAQYQAAFRRITYANYYAGTNNLNDNPIAGARTVSFTVTDLSATDTVPATASLPSNSATAVVTVVAVNDPPVLTAPTTAITYTEDVDTTLSIDPPISQFTISDPETSQIQGATVVISGVPATTGDGPSDTLIFATQNGITGTWNASALSMTLTGTTTLANYQAALRSITYSNTSQDPGGSIRTLTWTVTDADGGTATSAAVTSSLTVVAINDAPTVTNGASSSTYIEDFEPSGTANENHKKVISSTVTVNDVDNGSVTGATVTITNYQSTDDVLAATVQGSVTAVWNAGVLTFSGTASKATYQAILRTVTYQNMSDNPNTTTRTVQYVVSDGALPSSSTATANMQSSVTITATNDAPVLTAGGTLTFTEQKSAVSIADQIDLSKQPAVVLDSGPTITDAESNSITGATVQITGNYSSTEDVLAFANTVNITVLSWNSGTGTLTLTGTDTLSAYQTALQSITYQNTNVANPSALTRTVTWNVTDNGTTSGFLVNNASNSPTSTIIVVPVNDSPLLTGGGTALTYKEDYIGATLATKHSDVIDTSITITDAESSNIAGATVTISTNYKGTDVGTNTQDALSYAGNGTNINAGVWNSTTGILTLTTTAGQTATVANYTTAFANVKYTNYSDAPDEVQRTITWQVTDVGAVNASSSTVISTVNVAKTNDAPTNITLSNLGLYAASPKGTVIGSMTTTDPDLTGETHTYAITPAEFTLAAGKTLPSPVNINVFGDLVVNVNNAALSSGVYSVTIQVEDSGGLTFSKTFSITVVAAPFPSGNMTTVGDPSAITNAAKVLVNTVVSGLAGATPTAVTLTQDELRTLILAKLNQQLWGGNTDGLENIGTIVKMMGVTVTNAPQIQVTMQIKALSTLYSRLPTLVQGSFKTLVDTIYPYGSDYTFDVRLTVVPVVTGTTITYNNATSKLEVLHLKMLPNFLAPTVPYSIALDTLVANYNAVLTDLKSGDGTHSGMVFFLGDPIPKHVVTAAVGSVSSVYGQMATTGGWTAQAIPAPGASHTTVRNSATVPTSGTGVDLGHYLPGKISGISFNTGSITLTP